LGEVPAPTGIHRFIGKTASHGIPKIPQIVTPGDKISANELLSAYCSAMPTDCKDNDQTQTPEHTPAYLNGFSPNTEKLRHFSAVD
jgi:hypothetical protein